MNNEKEIIILQRDVEALLVPSGARILLQQGMEVSVTQALGSTYTVNIYGNLARIDQKDADALGKAIKPAFTNEQLQNAPLEELVQAQLKTCYDPEIPVNIVDLGLIYECKIESPQENEHHVHIKMTLTAPGCGMGPVIAGDVKQKLLAIPTVKQAEVDIVFDPPWSRDMMSEAARLHLGVM